MSAKYNDHLKTILTADTRLVDEQGDLMMNRIKDLANNLDENLLDMLLADDQSRDKFFIKVKDIYVFKQREFIFFLEQNSLDNSFTSYANRIGLTLNGKFLKDNTDVVLDFPYKDCVLEGGQSTEEGTDVYFKYDDKEEEYVEEKSKRKEIFYNNIIAKDEIDRLFEPKAFENILRYDQEGETIPVKFNRDENGNITDNLIIKGNNLLGLHSLQNEFKERVNLIYIDPPYNTGSDSFKYNDSFNESTWLTFMRNRLQAGKSLLNDKGFFCCHIDNNEGEYLKVLMDEVFGAENYVNTFYIRVRYPDKTLKQDMDFHKEMESIHIYRKSGNAKPILNEIETTIDKYIFYFEEIGQGKEIVLGGKKVVIFQKDEIKIVKKHASEKGRKEIWATGSILDGNSSGRFFRDYLTGRYKTDGLGVVYKIYGVGDETDGYRYFTGPQKSSATKGKYFQGIPNKQVESEDNVRTVPINNFYDLAGSFGNCRSEGGVELRSGKKPEELLKIIITHFSKEGDIVLDYHTGSGTTAAVAHKMKRQFIGLEQLDYGDNDSVKRLNNVIGGDPTGISKDLDWNGGGSFVYMELAKNNQKAIELIQQAENFEELENMFSEIYEKYFLHYNVKIQEFKNKIIKEENFLALPLEKQKEMFIRMLDNNQLYVNVDDMEDTRYGLNPEDIRLTKDFYQINE